MNTAEFQAMLRAKGRYVSPAPLPRGLFDRLFGRFDTWYYSVLFDIVLRANLAARRMAYARQRFSQSSFETLRLVERCGATVTIEGCGHLAALRGPAVIVANHMSLLETFLLPSIVIAFGDVAIVVKESLVSYPLFGPVVSATRPITVTRRNPREDLEQILTRGEAMLREGRHVLIFPQSTRTTFFSPADFNSIGVKLARRAGAQVVPAALKTDFMGIGKIIRDFGKIDRRNPVHVRFGPPAVITGTGREAHQSCVDFIKTTLHEWNVPVNEPGATGPEGGSN
ncbi:MAG: 1-acyl-sn-glycerol-3-phosphate acyltransferase [Lentisphaerae bacterium]|nr:1-acyl-sn-glycerol-3-phosphate acyltransferase [Lentisphaerota bacterium]